MASNKKLFKRALRSLSHGDNHLWELIKTKLKKEQIEYFENEFSLETVEEKVLGENTEVTTDVATEPLTISSPKKTKKVTARKTTSKNTKRKTTKKTSKSKEK